MSTSAITPQSQDFQPFMPTLGGLGESSPVLMSLLQLALQSMTSGTGMSLMGVNDRNIFDRMEQQRLTDQHFTVVRDAARNDIPTVVNAVRGLFETIGVPFGEPQAQFAGQMANLWASAAPIFTMMAPMEFDAMGGQRGMTSVFAHYAEMAGRRRYDPVTGEFGMTAESSSKLITDVTSQMFAGDRYLYAPLSAGRSGALLNELQSLGMAPRTSTLEDLEARQPARLQQLMSDSGIAASSVGELSPSDRDKLLKAPQVQDDLRSFDSRRVINTLQQWGGAVSAMQEIFGDAGMPNAPMQVLMNQLRQLSSGGFTQISPGEMEHSVRTMRNLTQNSGITMQGAGVLLESAQSQGARLGIESIFAPQAAMEGLAFAQAYEASGRGEYHGWGQPSIETLTQAHTSLVQSAVASPMGNRIGTALRLQATTGFDEGSEAEAFIKAATAGQTSYNYNGQVRSTNMQDDAFIQMLDKSSKLLTIDDVQFEMSSESANREYLQKHPEAVTAITRSQGTEFTRNTVQGAFNDAIQRRLQSQTTADTHGTAAAMSQAMSEAILSADFRPEFAQDEPGRWKFMAERAEAVLQAMAAAGDAGARGILDRFPDEAERQQYLQSTAATAWGGGDEAVRYTSGGQDTLLTRVALHAEDMQEGTNRALVLSESQATMQTALQRVGKGGPLRRFVESLINPGGRTIPQIAEDTFGGVQGSQVLEALNRPAEPGGDQPAFSVQDIEDSYKAWKTAEDEYRIANPNDRADKFNAMNSRAQEFSTVTQRLREQLEKSGMAFDPLIGQNQIANNIVDTENMRRHVAAGSVTAEETAAHATNIHQLVSTIGRDPVTASRLGEEGVTSVKELEDIQGQIEQNGASEDLLLEQQKRLSDIYARTDDSPPPTSAAAGIREINIGHLILKDADLGRGVLEFPPEDPDGP